MLQLRDSILTRTSFTSVMTQAGSDALQVLLERGDVADMYAYDRELVPFWCPDCARSYCGDHWQTWNVFDDATGGLDCIRGTCPNRHERMLED
jgi:hypothetical protein